MGLKRVTKKFLKYLIPILLILLIIPFTERGRKSHGANPFPTGTVRCCIAPGRLGALSEGYHAGFHYETLETFANAFEDSVRTFIAEEGAIFLDSLLLDSLDILVMPAEEYSSTEGIFSAIVNDSSMVWLMRDDPSITSSFAHWLVGYNGSDAQIQAERRFFHGFNPYRKTGRDKGILSPYDDILKEYASTIGWDWKMLAALVWAESKFKIDETSHRGACGLMQMMPRTASRFDVEDQLNPRQNIEAGVALLKRLQNLYADIAADQEELVKFTLAAYNAGEGRIADCIRFARANGVDPSTWENICTVMKDMDQNPEILAQQDVMYGPFKGFETRAYVKAVLNQYDVFRGVEPRYQNEVSDTSDTSATVFPLNEDLTEILLSPDSLSRVDLGDEHAREEKQQENGDKSEDIGSDDPR